MTNNTNDIDLAIVKTGNGDTTAFREIVHSSIVMLRAYVGFHVWNEFDRDDIIQDIYLKVFEDIHRYQPGTDFNAWLKTISRYKILEYQRKQQRKQSAHSKYIEHLQATVSEHIFINEKEYPLEGKIGALKHCLSILSKKNREMIELKYFKNLSMKEIGKYFCINSNAASVSIHRIRTALATCIAKKERAI